ncbi:FAD:protein FMN transferase [Sinanaerobacter sp. ZZT-01]|uniref:FAD:protein FMN transferase n=1 Tax=Sinanaerobacter sp. ZZT-01 TaxID=3111540 RepID=UPI002D782ADB|nr:FAD:protein FMN transferase [Sinanaerobacter sp. ZZT-01]WRR94447.1 FAD:protein FMN transferase [Sinanaerobacter sp. ZZT-01]
MKKLQRRLLGCIFILIFIVTQTSCAGKVPLSQTDFLLNTVCKITLYEGGDEQLLKDAFALCREYENRLSRTISQSDIGKINAAEGASVAVDKTTAEVILKGMEYGQISRGLFDITVGELAELWNFSGDNPSVPDEKQIEAALPHIGYARIHVTQNGEQNEVALEDPQAKLDLGGIAKGYIADKAAVFLKENGVSKAIINLGGNVVCIGEKSEGVPFQIGIEKPFGEESQGEKEILGTVGMKDKSIVTSGTYERNFIEKGVLYYHILDPQTGYPMKTDLDGISIIGPRSVDCDGLSTTCLMLGFEEAKTLIDSMPEYEAIFVKKDGTVVSTEGVALMKE